jgi:ankyrin repeat protein
VSIFDAIAAGDLERVRELAPAEGRARNAQGVSALMLARYHGQAAAAEAIRPHAGELDVFEAATVGDLDRLRDLLAADPALARASSADGYTALHFACFFGTAEAARALVEAGADLEAVATGENRVAPLQSAAAAGNVEAARVLLDAGADVNCREEGRFTPLHSAAQNGDEPLARLLLERGADREARLEDGRTARDLTKDDALRALLG